MMALERIKEIKTRMSDRSQFNDMDLEVFESGSNVVFLLKAFKVMREIAIRMGEHDKSYREEEIVDEEFESRMKE